MRIAVSLLRRGRIACRAGAPRVWHIDAPAPRVERWPAHRHAVTGGGTIDVTASRPLGEPPEK
jgi:hypothetical protein